jgi:hypothetical protein
LLGDQRGIAIRQNSPKLFQAMIVSDRMANKPSEKTLKVRELEARSRVQARRIDAIASVVGNLIKYACWFGCVFVLGKAIEALAGKTTLADIGIGLFGELKIERVLSLSVTGGSIVYGMYERKLRHDKTEYLQGRIRDLEKKLDPARSSSRLSERGTPRPEDASE